MKHFQSDDRGAVLPMVAILIVVLMVVASFVVDLGGVRVERAANQLIADASATAGALTAAETGSGVDVCNDVKAYVAMNTSRIGSFGDLDGIDCDAFPTSCDGATAEHRVSTVVNGVTVEIAFPVADDSPLMASGQIGAASQPASGADGDKCSRVGVRIQTEWQGTFSQLIGTDELPANVHAVAMTSTGGLSESPINLLTLQREECDSIVVNGTGLIVEPILLEDEDGGTFLSPGVAAADSSGTASKGCGKNTGVFRLTGKTSYIRADGPGDPLCADGVVADYQVGGLAVGAGCGISGAPAEQVDGTSPLWVGAGSSPEPLPGNLPMMTRAPIDHIFNCWHDYEHPPSDAGWAVQGLTTANQQDIPGVDECDELDDAHIFDLLAGVGPSGTPVGFTRVRPNLKGKTCSIKEFTVFPGDTFIDCDLTIQDVVVFQGNVVFGGDVQLSSDGTLGVNVLEGAEGVPEDPEAWEADTSQQRWVVFRGDQVGSGSEFSRTGKAGIYLFQTMVYLSDDIVGFKATGADAPITWTAPTEGPFEDLALWADAEIGDKGLQFSGGAGTVLEGVLFTPWSRVTMTGTSSGDDKFYQVSAQFISKALTVGGDAVLRITPTADRAVFFPAEPLTALMR